MLGLFLAFAASGAVAVVAAVSSSHPETAWPGPSIVGVVHDWGVRQAWRLCIATPRLARLRTALHRGARTVRRPGRHLAGYVKPLTTEMIERYALPGWRDETGPLPPFADYAPTTEPVRERVTSVLIDLTPEEIAAIKRAEDV